MNCYKVERSDVGKTAKSPVKHRCDGCDHVTLEFPFEPLGRVQKQDVGKLCVKRDGVWQVENDEQFKKRRSK